jgi:flavodoxin I
MKTLVIYDTLYGCTEKIARAIGGAIKGEVKVVKVGESDAAGPGAYDLIIIGSPTQGGRHTQAMQAFLKDVPAEAIKDKKVAAFDTRMKSWWVKVFGWAADRIASDLKDKGGNLIAPAEAFFVKGGKGPLIEGEEERAAAWAKQIAAKK